MTGHSQEHYDVLPGKWELNCNCGERQVYFFKKDLTFEVVFYPQTWATKSVHKQGNTRTGKWHIGSEDFTSFEKKLWLTFDGESGAIKALDKIFPMNLLRTCVDLVASAFGGDDSGGAYGISLIDADNIRVVMVPPCGGVLRRIPLGEAKSEKRDGTGD